MGERNRMLLAVIGGRFGHPQVKITQASGIVNIEISARISDFDKDWVLDTCRKRFKVDEEIKLEAKAA